MGVRCLSEFICSSTFGPALTLIIKLRDYIASEEMLRYSQGDVSTVFVGNTCRREISLNTLYTNLWDSNNFLLPAKIKL